MMNLRSTTFHVRGIRVWLETNDEHGAEAAVKDLDSAIREFGLYHTPIPTSSDLATLRTQLDAQLAEADRLRKRLAKEHEANERLRNDRDLLAGLLDEVARTTGATGWNYSAVPSLVEQSRREQKQVIDRLRKELTLASVTANADHVKLMNDIVGWYDKFHCPNDRHPDDPAAELLDTLMQDLDKAKKDLASETAVSRAAVAKLTRVDAVLHGG